MKLSVKPGLLKLLVLSSGILALLLHVLLYTGGMDEKGLLIAGYWAGTALWMLTVLTALLLVLLTRSIRGPEDYRDAFPSSFFGAVGSFALAAVLGITAWRERSADSMLGILTGVLGACAAVSLIAAGSCRLIGRKPSFLFHASVCGFFALRMVGQYQFWNSDPQLYDYVFGLLAQVALMLTAYQHAAFDADMGSHRNLWCVSLGAVFLCCTALRGAADQWLLLAAGFWALANLTSLTAKTRRQRPELILEDGPQEEV